MAASVIFDKLQHLGGVMDFDYMLACGIVWSKTADPDAGLELFEALVSPEPELRLFARDMLIHRRDNAMALLEGAVGTGVLTPEVAGPCIVELLRAGRRGTFRLPDGWRRLKENEVNLW